MEVLAAILLGLGLILVLIYGIVLLVKAFQTSILWGIASFFIPGVSLIFALVHWDVAHKAFLMSLLGILFIMIGFFILPEVFLDGLKQGMEQGLAGY